MRGLVQFMLVGSICGLAAGPGRTGAGTRPAGGCSCPTPPDAPPALDVQCKGEFDPAFIRALFDRGHQQVRGGFPWAKTPPGLEALK